jgi:hypothetical protein
MKVLNPAGVDLTSVVASQIDLGQYQNGPTTCTCPGSNGRTAGAGPEITLDGTSRLF